MLLILITSPLVASDAMSVPTPADWEAMIREFGENVLYTLPQEPSAGVSSVDGKSPNAAARRPSRSDNKNLFAVLNAQRKPPRRLTGLRVPVDQIAWKEKPAAE